MSLYINIPATSSGGSSAQTVALSRAQTLLGSTITVSFSYDFDTTSLTTATVTGTGACALSTTEKGGVINIATNAGAASTGIIRPTGSGAPITNVATDLWYAIWRLKFSTVPDAQSYNAPAIAGIGGGSYLAVGAIGSRSTALFYYDFYNTAGAPVANGSTAVSIDTNYHTFEMWSDTTNIRIAIDGTTTNTIAMPAATTSASGLRVDAGNGTTAANQQINLDYMVICTAR